MSRKAVMYRYFSCPEFYGKGSQTKLSVHNKIWHKPYLGRFEEKKMFKVSCYKMCSSCFNQKSKDGCWRDDHIWAGESYLAKTSIPLLWEMCCFRWTWSPTASWVFKEALKKFQSFCFHFLWEIRKPAPDPAHNLSPIHLNSPHTTRCSCYRTTPVLTANKIYTNKESQ